MERIKFCHVIDGSNFNPLLYNSIKYSDRSKFEYIVISFEKEGRLHEQMKELGVECFSIHHSSKLNSPRTLWRLYRFFRKNKIKIVQSHLFNASLIGLTAARLARVPVTIFTGHHSHEVPLHKRKVLTFIDGISGRFLAGHTIAPSTNMKEIFIRYQKIPSRKIEVLHHGFDLEAWKSNAINSSAVRKEFKIENKIVFGAVGRFFWVKGFETMFNAFAEVAAVNQNIVLLIAGDGPDKNKLQELVSSLNLKEKIIFAGNRKDIGAVMNCFDVFVHSSVAESFGMVFIEAFALGKPVISTRVGVAADIIDDGKNGFLTEPGDVKSLSSAMFNLLEKKNKWPEIGNCNIQIADRFSVQKTQALCDTAYLNWLAEK